MKEELKRLENNALIELSKAKNKDEVDKIRVKYLGRRIGLITLLSKKVSKIPIEERSGIGTLLRNARKKVEEEIGKSVPEQEQVGTKKNIDTTTPGRKFESGNLHPITLVIEEVKEIFHYLGFSWAEGPEVESDLYNFQKLKIPRDHPARDVQQTYYINDDLLLRTHTSNMQVRYMLENKPPIRVLFPGRVFRREMPDATHYPAFFQIEGLMVGRNVRMTSLLGTLDYFVKRFFGDNSNMKLPLSWIKEYVEVPSDPDKLAEDLQFSGTKVESLEKESGDLILDFEITPNRSDCYSVIGIAREISSLYKKVLNLPKVFSEEIQTSKEEPPKLTTENENLCPAYTLGLVDLIKVSKSPTWIIEKLEKSGLRAINNIVDITNYVMLEI